MKAASILTILLTAAISILAQTPGSNAKKMHFEQEILKTERELTDALLKRDSKTAEKLVADGFVQVVPDDKRRPAAELFPESESEFFLKGRDAQIMFLRDRTGRVTHALLHMNGVPVRARRVG